MRHPFAGPFGKTIAAAAVAIAAAAQMTASGVRAQSAAPGVARPVSTFGSLVTDRVEVRPAPGVEHAPIVVLRRAGLPVQVLEWSKGWGRVVDADGNSGWIAADLVSRRRTAIVVDANLPAGTTIALRATERASSDAVAFVEPGVIVGLLACDGRTCRVTTSGVRGYLDQRQLWGLAENEIIR